MKSIRLAALLFTAAAVAVVGVACSSGGGGGTKATPTPMSLSAGSYVDQGNSSTVVNGECFGFTINDANKQLTPKSAVQMNFLFPNTPAFGAAAGTPFFILPLQDETLPPSNAYFQAIVVSSDGSSAQLGFLKPTVPSYNCRFLLAGDFYPVDSVNAGGATYGVRMFTNLVSGTNSGVVTNAFTFSFPYLPNGDGIIHATGTVATAAKANNQFGYFPYYTGNSTYAVVAATVNGTAGTNTVALNTVAVDSTASQPAPVGLAFADHPDPAALWQGWDVDILSFTSNGQNNFAMGGQKLGIGVFPGGLLTTGTVGTANGVTYSLTVSTANSANITSLSGISPCPANFPVGTANFDGVVNGPQTKFVLFVDTAGTAVYNPAKAQGCTDRHNPVGLGSGVDGKGQERIYTVTLAAGQSIRVGAYSELGGPKPCPQPNNAPCGGADVVLYLVDASACTGPGSVISTCRAAADFFGAPYEGGAGTDSLYYKNTTALPQQLYLFVDSFNAGEFGTFKGYVEIK